VPEPMLLPLQRTLAALVLEPEGEATAFEGLAPGHRRALDRWRERLGTYRELARLSLVEPLEDMFPVLRALLETEGAWEGAVDAFLGARCLSSPHYRDIAPTFLGWLVESRWGQDRWPFLAELAHFELLEAVVARLPDQEPPPVDGREPLRAARIVLDPTAQVIAYAHAVHRAQVDAPAPPRETTCLLAFRDAEGEARILELTEATAALLVQAQAGTLGEVVDRLGIPDFPAVETLLRDLVDRGAIAGFALPA